MWKKIESTLQGGPPSQLQLPEDVCYYAREYISPEGYKASATNQLLFNFKISPSKKGTDQWLYKEKAIRRFAFELSLLLGGKRAYAIATMPTSKPRGLPEYDARFDDLMIELEKLVTPIERVEPIQIKNAVKAAHKGGPRRISEIKQNYCWLGLEKPTTHLILVDDVITSGAHYKAYKSLVQDHYPSTVVYGVFWARCVDRQALGQ